MKKKSNKVRICVSLSEALVKRLNKIPAKDRNIWLEDSFNKLFKEAKKMGGIKKYMESQERLYSALS